MSLRITAAPNIVFSGYKENAIINHAVMSMIKRSLQLPIPGIASIGYKESVNVVIHAVLHTMHRSSQLLVFLGVVLYLIENVQILLYPVPVLGPKIACFG